MDRTQGRSGGPGMSRFGGLGFRRYTALMRVHCQECVIKGRVAKGPKKYAS
jgi:hypothetical protein